jgi:hypothetical protein
MAIYAIIAHKGAEALGPKIETEYPDNYALPPSAWFVSDTIPAEQVCEKLSLKPAEKENSAQAMVIRVGGGAGFAAADVREWLNARREKKSRPFPPEAGFQEPGPLGATNHAENLGASNANAPTGVQDPEQDPQESPAPLTRARSWLKKLVSFIRFLMIFFIGFVAALAWQSYGRATLEAIDGAAREAICPPAAPQAQDTPDIQDAPDKASGPLPSPVRPAPPKQSPPRTPPTR